MLSTQYLACETRRNRVGQIAASAICLARMVDANSVPINIRQNNRNSARLLVQAKETLGTSFEPGGDDDCSRGPEQGSRFTTGHG